jgi:hypothetical protein
VEDKSILRFTGMITGKWQNFCAPLDSYCSVTNKDVLITILKETSAKLNKHMFFEAFSLLLFHLSSLLKYYTVIITTRHVKINQDF